MPRCCTCRQEKPAEAFYRDRSTKTGRSPRCAECAKALSKEMRAKNPEYQRGYLAAYRAINRDYLLEQQRARPRDWKAEYERRVEREGLGSEKRRAQQKLNSEIRAGRVERPSECSKCGDSEARIEGHHDDYSKPLDVHWLCSGCHAQEHKRARAAA